MSTFWMRQGDFALHDAFSGMWWMPMSLFLRIHPTKSFTTVESTSQQVFRQFASDVLMTRDWLDFSIEHMSKWWKQLYSQRSVNGNDFLQQIRHQQVLAVFQRYLAPRWGTQLPPTFLSSLGDLWWSVPQSTIVLLAYLPPGPSEDPSTLQYALASTLLSLQRIGMGRTVVVGPSENDKPGVQESFHLFQQHWQAHAESLGGSRSSESSLPFVPMELGYCHSGNGTTSTMLSGNIPKAAIEAFQKALQGSHSSQDHSCWLGSQSPHSSTTPRFHFVYLSEPDLLLRTRISALPAIGQALREGHVIAAHRWQPIPHASDFPILHSDDTGSNNQTDVDSDALGESDRRWILPSDVDVTSPKNDSTYVLPWANVQLLDSSATLLNTNEVDALLKRGKQVEVAHMLESSNRDVCCDAGNRHTGLLDFPKCQGKMSQSSKPKMWWQCGFGREGSYATWEDCKRKHKRLLSYKPFRDQAGTNVTMIAQANGRMCVPEQHVSVCP